MRLSTRLLLALSSATLAVACSASPSSVAAPSESALFSASPSVAAVTPTVSVSVESGPFGGAPNSAPQGPPPTAKVLEATPSKESALYLHVAVLFDNPSSRACRIHGYVLTWPGGKKTIALDGFSVPSHEQKKRSVKVHPDDGDLSTLTPEKASVEVKSDCAVP